MSHQVRVVLDGETDVSGWLRAAHQLAGMQHRPENVVWSAAEDATDLFAAGGTVMRAALLKTDSAASGPSPGGLSDTLGALLLHADPHRFSLAYRLLWRMQDQPHLMDIASDPDVVRAHLLAKAVRRDMHKMKAFVRFRAVALAEGGEAMVAWHEPDHHITAAVAPFFMRRFATMRWSILTPHASAHWDLQALVIGPGARRADAPAQDAREDDWRTYYASIFNPARVKVKAMKKEMPVKFWRNLPEAELIVPLIRSARARVREMEARCPSQPRRMAQDPSAHGTAMASDSQHSGLPEHEVQSPLIVGLHDLKPAIEGCRRCPLHGQATQGVPGEGPLLADIMFVGEQPGDQEDLSGQPFVGPAGKLFDTAIARAGIDRGSTYVTNAVKHFKFEPRGKRRIHQKPNAAEVQACSVWIAQEVRLVRPRLIVALGATAAFGLTGVAMPVQKSRGVIIAGEDWPNGPGHAGAIPPGQIRPDLLVTVHPSFLLRLVAQDDKIREWHAFLADLRLARSYLEHLPQRLAS